MAFNLQIPTLECQALIRTATLMWKNNYKIYDFNKHAFSSLALKERWPEFEAKICEKVQEFLLPQKMVSLLTTITKLVGKELRLWITYIMDQSLGMDDNRDDWPKLVNYMKYVQWTINGKVDRKRTAEALVRFNTDLSKWENYEISTTFCLDDVMYLWNREIQQYIKKNCFPNASNKSLARFLKMWTKVKIYGMEMDKKIPLICEAVRADNESAVRYLWSQMTEDERSSEKIVSCIARFLLENQTSSFALLSQMSEQQIDFLIENSVPIFRFLVKDWVYVEFFIPTLKRVYHSLSFSDLHDIMIALAGETSGYNRDVCSELFTYLWRNSSAEFINFVASKEVTSCFKSCCVYLCKSQDRFNLDLVLNAIDLNQRQNILSKCFLCYLNVIDWAFLESVAMKYILSEKELSVFKNECVLKADEICSDINVNDETQWGVLDSFLKFCLLPPVHYKRMFCFNENIKIKFMDGLMKYGAGHLELIEKFLISNYLSVDEIRKFKSEFITYEIDFLHFVENGFEFFDAIFTWCELTGEKLVESKKYFICNSKRFFLFVHLSFLQGRYEDIDAWIKYFLRDENEIEQFKKKLPYHPEVVKSRLWLDHFRYHPNMLKMFLDFSLCENVSVESYLAFSRKDTKKKK